MERRDHEGGAPGGPGSLRCGGLGGLGTPGHPGIDRLSEITRHNNRAARRPSQEIGPSSLLAGNRRTPGDPRKSRAGNPKKSHQDIFRKSQGANPAEEILFVEEICRK